MTRTLPLPLSLLIERVAEALLHLDPDTRQRLDQFDGKVIRVSLHWPPVETTLAIVDRRLVVLGDVSGPTAGSADTSVDLDVHGALSDLLSLRQGTAALQDGRVSLRGDIGLANSLRALLGNFDPDWEEPVSAVLGDSSVHYLNQAARELGHWRERTADALRDDTREWLEEEISLLAPTSEVKHFCNEVDAVRATLDRLDARVARLAARSDSSDRQDQPG